MGTCCYHDNTTCCRMYRHHGCKLEWNTSTFAQRVLGTHVRWFDTHVRWFDTHVRWFDTHVRWFDTNTTNRWWLLLLLGCLHCLIFHSSGLVCGKPRCLLLRHSGSRCLGPRTSSQHPWAPSGGGAFPRLGELGVSRKTQWGGGGMWEKDSTTENHSRYCII